MIKQGDPASPTTTPATTATTSICRRGAERYRLLYANEGFVDIPAPDVGSWRLELMGISADGFSFGLRDGGPHLEPGAHLEKVVVHIGSTTLKGGLTIAHATEEFAAGTICGARFHPATESDRMALKKAIESLGW
jgi:hypothetical protein